MSETRFRAAGRTLTVALGPEGDGYAATVDGVAHRIDAVRAIATASVGGATVDAIDLEIDGRSVHAIVARTPGRVHVAVGGSTVVLERADDAERGGPAGAGSGSVVAPMPGKIVSVLVRAGDPVAAGQPLVVVEAMKMETTLVAEIDGTVRAVHVEAGAMADAGALLIEIAPAS